MPRPNRPRTLGTEPALARRISLLCHQRGWKYPELAERMTAAGCPIQTSALYKLHADPPRRITVTEFVALCNVFDLEPNELLKPPEIAEREWADDVARDFIGATIALDDAYAGVLRAGIRLAEISGHSSDLAEFVGHQWKAASPARQWFGEFAEVVEGEQLSRLANIAGEFWKQVLAVVDGLADQGAGD